jgi:hypothetical protein
MALPVAISYKEHASEWSNIVSHASEIKLDLHETAFSSNICLQFLLRSIFKVIERNKDLILS